MLVELGPHGAAVDTELAGEGSHADAVGSSCSHSVHFLVREACSGSSPWLCGRADERIIGFAVTLTRASWPLIPCGNQPLDPWSPVPVVLHCVHQSVVVETLDLRHRLCRRGAGRVLPPHPARARRSPRTQGQSVHRTADPAHRRRLPRRPATETTDHGAHHRRARPVRGHLGYLPAADHRLPTPSPRSQYLVSASLSDDCTGSLHLTKVPPM